MSHTPETKTASSRNVAALFTRQLESASHHLAAVRQRRARQTKHRQTDTTKLQNGLEPAA